MQDIPFYVHTIRSLSIHPLMDILVVSILSIMNNATINMVAHLSLWDPDFNSLDNYQKAGLLNQSQ